MTSKSLKLIKGQNGTYRIVKQFYSSGIITIYKGEVVSGVLKRKKPVLIKHISEGFDKFFVTKIGIFKKLGLYGTHKIHPNLMQIYDVVPPLMAGRNDFYIITEYVEGRDLEEFVTCLLTTKYKLTNDELRKIMLAIAKPLLVLHASGIIHSDIRPANVMWSVGKTNSKNLPAHVTIVDYDTLCAIIPTGNDILKIFEICDGFPTTIGYSSPDILMNYMSLGVDKFGITNIIANDIWAYGLVCLELAIGMPWYLGYLKMKGVNDLDVMGVLNAQRVMLNKQTIKMLLDRLSKANDDTKSIIMHCLNFDPRQRPTFDDIVKKIKK